MDNELITQEAASELATIDVDTKAFELAQRKANVYAKSSLVPKEYQGNIGNVLIAMNMAKRLGADQLMVMQNLYVVHGRPGWSSQFLIATFNECGKFGPLQFRFTGKKGTDSWGCIAFAKSLVIDEIVEGTEVTIKMAKDEGWYTRNGSKWPTLTEQMLRYRAAAFFIRTTAPEVSMGLMTSDELQDMPAPAVAPQVQVEQLTDILDAETAPDPPLDNEIGEVRPEFKEWADEMFHSCECLQDVEDVGEAIKDRHPNQAEAETFAVMLHKAREQWSGAAAKK